MSNENTVEETTVTEAPKGKMTKADQTYWVPLDWIVSNTHNPRIESTTVVLSQGYGIFDPKEGSDLPSLVTLARGTDEQKDEFVKLMKTDEEFVRFASKLRRDGQIDPVKVVKIDDRRYDIEDGCRRFLAQLYNSLTGATTVRLLISDVTKETDHRNRAATANLMRKEMTRVELAYHLQSILKKENGKNKTMKELEAETGVEAQTCRNTLLLLKLANSKKEVKVATVDDQGKKVTKTMTGAEVFAGLSNGTIPEYVARAVVTKKDDKPVSLNPGERRRSPTFKELENDYTTKEVDDVWTEAVRKWVAVSVLQIEYNDLPTVKKNIEASTAAG